MNENINWPNWVTAAIGAAGALWFIFKHIFSFVTREELQQTIQRFHDENSTRLDTISETVLSTQQRVDDIYRDFRIGQ